ncbi:rhodanese-like domain-containing protein [Mannheimia granulomatis]|uniref:rhodanese-like domain-containing protein n=1 Tax=Mannheimia granulomatis TaxID=85402 RepID=UPI00159D432E|nr:rhodanese-like domain-containing protein [Mannheimia granulomatis]QLB14123.1 rhodanese-like domain-containing protein [Mannheimia granulomatis]
MEQLTFAEQIQLFVANHTIMVFAWVALLGAVIFSFYKSATSKYKIVDNAQATQLINKEDGVVIDVRSDEEFRMGHIIDSIHILPSDLKANKIHQIEKYKDRPVIFVDTNGLSSAGLANVIAKQGFNKVYVLKEGMAGWRASSLPTVKKHK